MTGPYMTAEARLSTPNISFTTGSDPELILSLTLENTNEPITIIKKDHIKLFSPETSIAVFDITRQKNAAVTNIVSIDVNQRSSPPVALVPEAADKFMTLHPKSKCDITKTSFLPLGARRQATRRIDDEKPHDKYQFARAGMHFLNPGHEYKIKVRDDLHISTWMEAKLNELTQEGSNWQPKREEVEIIPTEGFQLRVEE
ncbi:hypothetical protein HJFPF1_00046 [Paramyrothecium foliicola]|nr:hypothetical protein HJFPF1_00046 [Paramyrothecium foliicola]